MLKLTLGIALASLMLLPVSADAESGQVEGQVVDSSGRPMPDVRIFNSSDGAQVVETQSDSSGHFRLRGFAPGPVYIFAQKEGCRFTGLRTQTGASDLRLIVLRGSEPPPVWRPRKAPMSLEDQQRLAHRLLEKLWSGGPRGKQYHWIPTAMSRLDPRLSLRWAEEARQSACSSEDYSGFVAAEVAKTTAERDFDEALAMIVALGVEGTNAINSMAHHYAGSDREKALRCTEELLVRARAVDQPWRSFYLADAAVLMIRLGVNDAGRKLLDEAVAMTSELGSTHVQVCARGAAAVAVAEVDLNRALGLLKPISDPRESPDKYRCGVAVASCVNNLDRALDVLKGVSSGYEADCARRAIACRIAATHPEDALRVIESVGIGPKGSIDRREKALKAVAFGRVAEALAPKHNDLAFSLIDRAFDLLPPGHERGGASDGAYAGWAGAAGFICYQAERIGYPDMNSVMNRALARRPKRSGAPQADVVKSQLLMAAFLAAIDPMTARDLLTSIPDVPFTDSDCQWLLKAWLLADASRGEVLFDKAFGAIKDKQGSDDQFYELVQIVSLLAAPQSEKARWIAPYPHFAADARE